MDVRRFVGRAGRVASTPAWWWRFACLATAGSALVFWMERIWTHYAQFGLFRWLGVDYGVYFAQSVALQIGDRHAIYDLDALHRYHQRLVGYTADPALPLFSGHVLYPPVFAWLFAPFTLPPPPIGFALWTGLNVLAAIFLARRVAGLFPQRERVWVSLLLLTSFPVVQTLVLGQPMILLAVAVAEGYLALRTGRDLRAGLWLACLAFKPQYAVLIGPLLLWKRRWAAVVGAALGTGVILGASLLVAGIPVLLDYPAALREEGVFRGTLTPSFPWVMINWRSLVLFFRPDVGDTLGILLTLLLSAMTVLLLVPAWRGPWLPSERLFPARMSLLVVATLLANYHSHLHGAALLAMPLAAVLAEGQPSRNTRVAIGAAVFLPTMVLAQDVFLPGTLRVSPLFAMLLVVCFGSLLAEVWPASHDNRDRDPA